MSVNLHASLCELGEYVTQIIHFVDGEKRTITDIETASIKQGQFTKFKRKNGSIVMINDKNVLMVEIFKQE